MALASSSIPNMVNGISQQPAALRMTSQCEEQLNAMSSPVEGLGKRPPTKHVARILEGLLPGAYVHTINRDLTERYIVVVMDGDLKVFDLDGNQKVVNFPNGKTYLAAQNPKTAFRTTSVIDYTFVVNKSATTRMTEELSPDRGTEAIVFIKQANYSTDMTITVEGQTVSYTYPASSPISTSACAADLLSKLQTALGTTDWDISREGSVIWIKRKNAADFNIKVSDSRSNTQMYLAKGTVQNFDELPTVAPAGFVVEIVGDSGSDTDNYFVKFEPTSSGVSFGQGVWKETVKPGIPYRLDPATMPHGLVREADGTFSFKQLEWGERIVGDEDSSPTPTFVDRQINDVVFYKRRLGFLSDENLILSRAGEFFEFFHSTVITLIDSDPVDTSASHTKVSTLYHAVPFNERLILFSDQTQFVLEEGAILATKPPDMDVMTEFESSLQAKPVGAGKTVFFTATRGAYAAIREYYIETNTQTNDAADITGHVPIYIPQGVFKLAVASNEDILMVLSEGAPNKVFVYKYLWSAADKIQSSWSDFTFANGSTILNVDFIDNEALFLIQYPDGVYLEKMVVSAGQVDHGSTLLCHLDRRVTDEQCEAAVYDELTNTTTWTLPYQVVGEMQAVTRYPATTPGLTLTITEAVGNRLSARGRFDTTPVYIGRRYLMRYVFSTQMMRSTNSRGGSTVIEEGRLQLRFWTLLYSQTGYFEAKVTPQGRDSNTYRFTGRVLGAASATIGSPAISTGRFKFPVMSKNDRVVVTLENDSHLPSRFLSAGWEGLFTIRSKRL